MLGLGLFAAAGQAQTVGPGGGDNVATQPQQERAFSSVEEMPKFPGGDKALAKYLAENIRYPESAKKEGIEGKVYVEFIVEADGSLTNIRILRGLQADIDKETIRAVKGMPKWVVGKQAGKAVRVIYTLPVEYRLN